MFQKLPIELLKLILSSLSSDLAVIKACTLVCRSWLPDARRALFHSIRVDGYSDYDQILATLRTSPEIMAFVKHLDIKIWNDFKWLRWTNKEEVCSFLCDHAPESLESLKVEIQELEQESDQGSCSTYIWPNPC